MALTPEGTPYVESSDLVANYPAASLSLANRVDLVGVLPFATSTARTTAIPSPTDGQYVYLQDTNTTQFYNGSTWQTAGGISLVIPTSIANSGGTASLNGGAVTFSGVTSISLNGIFSSGYSWYRIVYYTDASGSTQYLNMRMRNAGSDNTTSNYATQQLDSAAGSITSARLLAQNLGQIGAITSTGGWGSMDIYNPFASISTSWSNIVGFAGPQNGIYMGQHSVSSSFDGFTFFPGANSFTGTIRVYGYQN